MKYTVALIEVLVALLFVNGANAFVARETRQLQRNVYRENLCLFQEPPTLEKEVTETEKSAAKTEEVEEEMTETQMLMKQVKEAGTAGVISYALWEWGFWTLSVPVCAVGYYQVTGHWPDFSDPDDQKTLGAEAFAFVNFARFAVPLRIGLALSTTPWIDENIVKRFLKKDEE